MWHVYTCDEWHCDAVNDNKNLVVKKKKKRGGWGGPPPSATETLLWKKRKKGGVGGPPPSAKEICVRVLKKKEKRGCGVRPVTNLFDEISSEWVCHSHWSSWRNLSYFFKSPFRLDDASTAWRSLWAATELVPLGYAYSVFYFEKVLGSCWNHCFGPD